MITSAIINLLTSALSAIFSLFPTGNLNNLFTSVTPALTTIGATMSQWNNWFPFSEILNALSIFVSVIMPAVITYKLANWTWRHIPDVAGFGPGAG